MASLVARVVLPAVLLAAPLGAQEIRVYSEFRRIDPFGEVIPQDRGGRPREILSPSTARNSHATFRVIVEAPAGAHYHLFVGTNPEDIFEIDLYKEMWRKDGDGWTPDRLLPIETPYVSHIPDRYHGIANQTVEAFVMDVFIPPGLDAGRYKLEPQVSCNGRWAIYPMEVRVSDVIAPDVPASHRRLPAASLPADEAAMGPLREYLCGTPEENGNGRESVRLLVRRNVLEDMAIARAKEQEVGKDVLARHLLEDLHMDAEGFCAAEEIERPNGPEWYLRGRDFLYRGTFRWR